MVLRVYCCGASAYHSGSYPLCVGLSTYLAMHFVVVSCHCHYAEHSTHMVGISMSLLPSVHPLVSSFRFAWASGQTSVGVVHLGLINCTNRPGIGSTNIVIVKVKHTSKIVEAKTIVTLGSRWQKNFARFSSHIAVAVPPRDCTGCGSAREYFYT